MQKWKRFPFSAFRLARLLFHVNIKMYIDSTKIYNCTKSIATSAFPSDFQSFPIKVFFLSIPTDTLINSN